MWLKFVDYLLIFIKLQTVHAPKSEMLGFTKLLCYSIHSIRIIQLSSHIGIVYWFKAFTFKERHFVCSKWSINLPGVVTKMLIPFRILAFSDFFLSPPKRMPGTIRANVRHKVWKQSKLWTANSLVGTIIRAWRPDCRLIWGVISCNLCKMGKA